jgi:hypothetical protein
MSHFTEIKTQIKDIEALRSACQEMGLTLLQDTESRGYDVNRTKGDYVIKLKGPFDIVFQKAEIAEVRGGLVSRRGGRGRKDLS